MAIDLYARVRGTFIVVEQFEALIVCKLKKRLGNGLLRAL
jgi:hypothetical protein